MKLPEYINLFLLEMSDTIVTLEYQDGEKFQTTPKYIAQDVLVKFQAFLTLEHTRHLNDDIN